MKVLYTTDLHGSRWKYDRLLAAAQKMDAEMVINGGDLLPKSGDRLVQEDFISTYLDQHFSQFNAAGIHYLCCMGNDDLMIYDDLLDEVCEKYPLVQNIAQRKAHIGAFEFIGMNWVVDYPFRLKDRCRMDTAEYVFQEQFGAGLLSSNNGYENIEDWFSYARQLPTIEDEMKKLVRPEKMGRAVYVIHMPPYRLGLDRCAHGAEVGSKAIYDFILREQPVVSLHGHIHESPQMTGKWRSELNDTVCVQPGQLAPFTYVSIDLNSMEMNRINEDRTT